MNKPKIIQDILDLLGNEYGVDKEVPKQLQSLIDNDVYNVLIREEKVLVTYDPKTKLPRYVKRLT